MKHNKRNTPLPHITWLPKCDTMNPCRVILGMIDVVKNCTLRLADRIVTAELLVYGEMIQLNVFYVVYHMGNAAKAASALLVRVPFVTDREYVLYLLADEGNLHGSGGGVGTWTSSFT